MTLLKARTIKIRTRNFLCPASWCLSHLSETIIFIVVLAGLFLSLLTQPVLADEIGTASWYSVESCKREGTSGIMANGEVLNDDKLTCASWDYPFGTRLQITHTGTSKSIKVWVTDRGPSKKLYRMGRIIDLSKRAFSEIADLKSGLIQVKVTNLTRKK